jgi:hypothetical protein
MDLCNTANALKENKSSESKNFSQGEALSLSSGLSKNNTDSQFVVVDVKQSGDSEYLSFASNPLKNDKPVVLDDAKCYGNVYEYSRNSIQNDSQTLTVSQSECTVLETMDTILSSLSNIHINDIFSNFLTCFDVCLQSNEEMKKYIKCFQIVPTNEFLLRIKSNSDRFHEPSMSYKEKHNIEQYKFVLMVWVSDEDFMANDFKSFFAENKDTSKIVNFTDCAYIAVMKDDYFKNPLNGYLFGTTYLSGKLLRSPLRKTMSSLVFIDNVSTKQANIYIGSCFHGKYAEYINSGDVKIKNGFESNFYSAGFAEAFCVHPESTNDDCFNLVGNIVLDNHEPDFGLVHVVNCHTSHVCNKPALTKAFQTSTTAIMSQKYFSQYYRRSFYGILLCSEKKVKVLLSPFKDSLVGIFTVIIVEPSDFYIKHGQSGAVVVLEEPTSKIHIPIAVLVYALRQNCAAIQDLTDEQKDNKFPTKSGICVSISLIHTMMSKHPNQNLQELYKKLHLCGCNGSGINFDILVQQGSKLSVEDLNKRKCCGDIHFTTEKKNDETNDDVDFT